MIRDRFFVSFSNKFLERGVDVFFGERHFGFFFNNLMRGIGHQKMNGQLVFYEKLQEAAGIGGSAGACHADHKGDFFHGAIQYEASVVTNIVTLMTALAKKKALFMRDKSSGVTMACS